LIWEKNIDTPMHFYHDLEKAACNPSREAELLERSRETRFHVRTGSKMRRNQERAEMVKQQAIEHNITQGEHVSWGFENVFDEYFGTLNASGQPHGLGIKFYSDGSIYIGKWQDGQRHALGRAMWQRPDGSQYEGSWVHGQKHGTGTQIFPDGSRYKGEFARGYEHGQGTRTQPDGSVFEGRFRFGKKDGPGTLTHPDQTVEKRIFKESAVFHERTVPEIVESLTGGQDTKFFEVPSLMKIAITSLASTMHKHRALVPPQLLHRRLPEFMKEWVAKEYLETIYPKGSQAFIDTAPQIAFKAVEEVNFRATRFAHFDCESMLYFTTSNNILRRLFLTMNRLDPASLDMICKKLFVRTWPCLEVLDMSFNRIDVSIIKNLIAALRNNPTIKTLKLSGCNIGPLGAELLAKYVVALFSLLRL
jgi:hypothetical protein